MEDHMVAGIYYFSGTGNSYMAAEKLGTKLKEECRIIPVAGAMNSGEVLCCSDVAGFVFPLYYFGLPEMVERFLMGLVFRGDPYIFAVITRGKTRGRAVHDVKKILGRKGRSLNSAFYLTMPGNYIPLYGGMKEGKIAKNIRQAEKDLEGYANIISAREDHEEKEGFLTRSFARIMHKKWKEDFYKKDSLFTVDDSCTSCGICSSVCPVNNIEIVSGKPVWKHGCQQCMACIQFCPQQAIQIEGKTRNRRRYHYPGISYEVIEQQKQL
jgi:ferredoxin/flavodoxin